MARPRASGVLSGRAPLLLGSIVLAAVVLTTSFRSLSGSFAGRFVLGLSVVLALLTMGLARRSGDGPERGSTAGVLEARPINRRTEDSVRPHEPVNLAELDLPLV